MTPWVGLAESYGAHVTGPHPWQARALPLVLDALTPGRAGPRRKRELERITRAASSLASLAALGGPLDPPAPVDHGAALDPQAVAVLRLLAKPRTVWGLAQAAGLEPRDVRRALGALERAGRVASTRVDGAAVWRAL